MQKDRRKASEEEEKTIDRKIEYLKEEIRQLYKKKKKKKGGDRVPIKKVRIRENIGNAEMLKPSKNIKQYVNPRNNHHVLIYKDEEGQLKEQIVTLWEAVERKNQGDPIYKLPPDGIELITTIERNDMFLLGLKNENLAEIISDPEKISNYLYKVQKISAGDYFFEFCFRKHVDSRADKHAKKDYVYIKNFGDGRTGWKTFNPIKVKINQLGEIEN